MIKLKNLLQEFEYRLTRQKELPASRLKVGDIVKYNDYGPYVVMAIIPDKVNNNQVTVRLSNYYPDITSDKWKEITMNSTVPTFIKIKQQ
jgi:hypothetical protein